MQYTYLIGWSKLNRWYYGCQFGKTSNPDNLWKTYFTSSPIVKKFREKYGEPDIIKIRKIFNSAEQCRLWEYKVLKRMKVRNKIKWLNRQDAPAIPLNICATYGMLGKSFSEESKFKSKMSNVGQRRSSETRKNISLARKRYFENGGVHHKPMAGRRHSEEAKAKMSAAACRRNKELKV